MEIIEFQRLGCNMVTVGFVGAMCTSLLGFWGIIKQAQTIWSTKSGKSVPLQMHAYGILFFASGCVYGFAIGSLALMIMGLRAVLTVPVVAGLIKYQPPKWWEYALCLLFLAVWVSMLLLPYKDTFYFIIALGAIISFIPQPIAMLRNHSRGSVSLSFLWTLCIGVSFWSVYAFAIGDWVLRIVNPFFLVLVVTTLIIWYVIPPEKEES